MAKLVKITGSILFSETDKIYRLNITAHDVAVEKKTPKTYMLHDSGARRLPVEKVDTPARLTDNIKNDISLMRGVKWISSVDENSIREAANEVQRCLLDFLNRQITAAKLRFEAASKIECRDFKTRFINLEDDVVPFDFDLKQEFQSDMIVLREFTKTDWYGWAGAERPVYGDGVVHEPLIGYMEFELENGSSGHGAIIVDKNGVSCTIDGDDIIMCGFTIDCSFEIGKHIASAFPNKIKEKELKERFGLEITPW